MAIVDKINAFLTSTPPDLPLITLEAGKIAESVFKRQFLSPHTRRVGIGLSEAGKCARQSSLNCWALRTTAKRWIQEDELCSTKVIW